MNKQNTCTYIITSIEIQILNTDYFIYNSNRFSLVFRFGKKKFNMLELIYNKLLLFAVNFLSGKRNSRNNYAGV